MAKTSGLILVVILALLAGMVIDRYVIGIKCEQVGFDTVWTEIEVVKDSIIIKPEYIPVVTDERINIDSLQNVLYEEAKRYWQEVYKDSLTPVEYIAKADTSFKDSTVALDIDFISPIPLHPASYFRFNRIEVFRPEVTITVQKKRTFWDVIIPEPSAQVGAGVGLINKQFDIYAGIGLSWRLDSD